MTSFMRKESDCPLGLSVFGVLCEPDLSPWGVGLHTEQKGFSELQAASVYLLLLISVYVNAVYILPVYGLFYMLTSCAYVLAEGRRITSYNVCYTKLLRPDSRSSV